MKNKHQLLPDCVDTLKCSLVQIWVYIKQVSPNYFYTNLIAVSVIFLDALLSPQHLAQFLVQIQFNDSQFHSGPPSQAPQVHVVILIGPWKQGWAQRKGRAKFLPWASEIKGSCDFTLAVQPCTAFDLFQATIFQKQQICPIFKEVLIKSLLSLTTFSDGQSYNLWV